MKITRYIAVFLFCNWAADAVIVDRIAIVAGKRIIKDSDIADDIRLTAFLNQEPLAFTPAIRKEAANRLLDQGFIRDEVDTGEYPKVSAEEVRENLEKLVKARYATDAGYKKALAVYGISEDELKARLLWQLTVLRFIDARFRPSAYIGDDEIRQYFESHRAQFKGDLNASRDKIEEILAGERTNKEFYDWLDRRRKATAIRYLEESLK